jgi:predicted outer membrane lipoprotein
MWLSIWIITVALAVGFSVIAVAMQADEDQAALGRE